MRPPSLAVALLAAAYHVQAQLSTRAEHLQSPPVYPSPWMDPHADGWAEAYVKAKEFVSQMTLLEKVNLTTGVGWMGDRCLGNTGGAPRLKLRGLCLQDSPAGIRMTDYNSVFPSGQTTAATWDRRLIHRRGEALGAEHRAKGVDVVLAPVAGPIGKLAASGRIWEGFSVDPWLTGVAMAETIKGIQKHAIACAKHFIANEQEHFRQPDQLDKKYKIAESLSSNIDDKTMHELYLWPFVDAVHAGVGSIMCSYNQVNNSYACQNSKLMNGILKGELGFQGFVISDWAAQHSGVPSAVAGLDMTMPGDIGFNSGNSYWGANLTIGVLNGTVPDYRIDDMALRIMAAFFKVGFKVEEQPEINFSSWTRQTIGPLQFQAQENKQVINHHVDVRRGKEHAKLIREIAAKGTVLLKNEGALPLKEPRFLAVIGEDAGPGVKGPNGCTDRGCNLGTLAIGYGSGNAEFPYLITPDQALSARVTSAGGRYESVLSNYQWEATWALISQPFATAIVFVNANAGEGYLIVGGNEGDRQNLTLWNSGDELVRNVSSVNNNTIVVIHSVGPVLLTEMYDNPNITAIVWAGLPGQESGNSIADVLFGDVNPGGKSPFTWGPTPESYGTELMYEPNNGESAPQDDFTEGVFIDYFHFDRVAPGRYGGDASHWSSNSSSKGPKTPSSPGAKMPIGVMPANSTRSKNSTGLPAPPIYPFGFGLSYTTFKFSDLVVTPNQVPEYKPTTGETLKAPTIGKASNNGTYSNSTLGNLHVADYVFPSNAFRYIYKYIYPYLNTTNVRESANGINFGDAADKFLPAHALDSSAQPKHPASGANGGNPRLWDVMYTVKATVTNTGSMAGDEVPQLYVSLGGPHEPLKVLRGFDRLHIAAGTSATFHANLTRRDISNWDTESQNWVITKYPKKVWVGSSSRDLPLSAPLEVAKRRV